MKHRFKFLTLLAGIAYNTSRYLCQRKQIYEARQRTIVLEYVPIQFPVWNIDA